MDDSLPILNKSRNNKANCFLYLLTSCATISGLLFGYDTGIISGAMLSLRTYFSLSSLWIELVVSGTIGMAALSSLTAGALADYLGRVRTILLSCAIFTIGAFIMAFSQSKEILLLGRITVGAAIGLSSVVVPVYIAEVGPSNIRGILVTVNQLFITIGIVFANLIAALFSYMEKDGWRYMLGLAAVPSFIQFFAFFFLPESPRWLVANGRSEDARAVLAKIRSTDTTVEKELYGIKTLIESVPSNKAKCSTLKQIFETKHVRKALMVGCGMQLFQQFGGINTIIYYSATIVKMAGIADNSNAIWCSTAVAVVNMFFTIIGLLLVERSGRKCLSIGSMVGMMFSCMTLAIGFQLTNTNKLPVTFWQPAVKNMSLHCENYRFCGECVTDMHCGYCYSAAGPVGTNSSCLPYLSKSVHNFCNTSHLTKGLLAQNYCPSNFAWIPVLGLALYVMFFAPGMGPMPWVVNSEIYPMWARATCNSMSVGVNWISNLVIAMTFITLTETITRHGTFWLFFGVCAVGALFVTFCLPETRGKSLEEVEQLFMDQNELEDFHSKSYNQNLSDSSEKLEFDREADVK